MPDLAALKAIAHGRVQGVYYRASVRGYARSLGLTGYARNLPSGDAVEVYAEGPRERLEELLRRVRTGPSGAMVLRVDENWLPFTGSLDSFEVKY